MSKLLDYLVQVQNKSGAVPSAPLSLKSLKAGILGVPFDTFTPGMSGVLSLQNLVPGLVQTIQSLGSLTAVGNFGQILSRAQGELGGTALSTSDPGRLAQALQRATSADELRGVAGAVQSLGASLMTAAGATLPTPTYSFPPGPGGVGAGIAAGDLQISGNVIWHNVVNPWVQKTGDTMTGDLHMANSNLWLNRGDALQSFVELSNNVAAGALRVGPGGFTTVFFDNRYGFNIAADTNADITSGSFLTPALVFQISNTGVVTATNTIVGAASTANTPTLRIPPGVPPSTPTTGDVWATNTNIQTQLGGATGTIPFLEVNNNWSGGVQVFTNASAYSPQIYLINITNDGNGPYYLFRKQRGASTGVNVNDTLGTFEWQAMSANGTVVASAYMVSTATAVGNGYVDSSFSLVTSQGGGALATRFSVVTGLAMAGTADMGSGTMNATGFYRSGVALPIQRFFESGQQTITSGGSLTIAHGLGVQPKLYIAVIQCVIAEAGFSVGNEIPVSVSGTSTQNDIFPIVPDATNINIRFGSSTSAFQAGNFTTGAHAALTNANWKLVVRAWA